MVEISLGLALDVVGDPLVIRIYVGSTLGILNKPNS
jgi:hypothetical protein